LTPPRRKPFEAWAFQVTLGVILYASSRRGLYPSDFVLSLWLSSLENRPPDLKVRSYL